MRFLNGQVTADVAKLRPGAVLPACLPTPKGKLAAVVEIRIIPGGLLLDSEPSLAEELQQRLDRYIISDDVTVEDATAEYALIFCAGFDLSFSGLLPLLESTVGPTARDQFQVDRAQRYGLSGHDILLPHAAWTSASAAWTARDDADHPVALTPSLLETLRVEAGLPAWGAELDADTLPAEAGIDRTHIDFHKGCYLGQEVISRVKSVGRVNRQLCGFLSESEEPIFPGSRIFAASADPATDRPLGEITSSLWSHALARPIALGYLKPDAPIDHLIAVAPENPALLTRLTVSPLPFTQAG